MGRIRGFDVLTCAVCGADCGESLKKPKVQNHTYGCSASAFNCIDCGRTFDRYSVKEHTTCVTEHDKYAKGATKPGGYAASGYFGNGETAKAPDASAPAGLEFLSVRAPWKCSICNVTCTSQETLWGHASGAKHKRRAKAASKPANGQNAKGNAAAADAGATETQQSSQAQASDAPEHDSLKAAEKGGVTSGSEDRKEKKKANRKAEAESAAPGAAPAVSTEPVRNGQPGKKRKKEKQPQSNAALSNGHPAEGQDGSHISDENGCSNTGLAKTSGKKQKQKKRLAAVPGGSAAQAAVSALEPLQGKAGPSWSKLAKQLLASCEGHSMKMSKLQREVLAAAGLPKQALAEHQQAIVQKISAKRKTFSIMGEQVSLKVA